MWQAVLVVCDWELSEAPKKDALDQTRVHAEEHKRMAVLEYQRRIKEAMASKPAPPPEDIEMKAPMKAMGAMEEGDALLGSILK
ncbi:hypothetical protein ACLB2K_065754 [Fragaria x ananassa]